MLFLRQSEEQFFSLKEEAYFSTVEKFSRVSVREFPSQEIFVVPLFCFH
jgi:hypothetical protein